ncbi:MAG: hypothetical protein WEC83_00400 [Patescibacteria group bacterium]
MLVFIEGSDSFLARQAINLIKKKYLDKNPDGVELVDIDAAEQTANWADLQAVPLFAQTRLVVLRRVSQLNLAQQESLASFLMVSPASTVAVLWDDKPLPAKSALAAEAKKAGKTISAAPLAGNALKNHLANRAKTQGHTLSDTELSQLIGEHGSDLWAQETAIAVLALGGQTERRGQAKPSEQFALYRAIQTGNWKAAANFIRQDIAAGQPIELLVGMIAAALRKRPESAERVAITNLLADLDLGLKTGLLDDQAAAALLAADLLQTGRNRVRWETVWEESFGG